MLFLFLFFIPFFQDWQWQVLYPTPALFVLLLFLVFAKFHIPKCKVKHSRRLNLVLIKDKVILIISKSADHKAVSSFNVFVKYTTFFGQSVAPEYK